MIEFIARVEESLKSFVAGIIDKSSIIIIFLLIVQIGLTVLNIRINLEAYVHNINKTENRYRCTITALNNLLNPENKGKKVDYFAGEIKKDLSADEEIQRNKNHRKYLYHSIKDWF